MGFSLKSAGKAVTSAGKSAVQDPAGTARGAVMGGLLGPVGMAAGAVGGSGGFNKLLSTMHGDAHKSNPNADVDAAVAGGPPKMPDYMSAQGADGKLLDQYKYNANTVDFSKSAPDMTALNALQTGAMSTAPSAWAGLAQNQNTLQTTKAKNDAAQQALSGNATARAQMAMGGGLSSGSAERIARSGAQGLNQARQGAGLAGNTNSLNVSMQDAAQKQATLEKLPGMQLDIAKYNAANQEYNNNTLNDAAKYNTSNTLANNTQANAANLYKYGQGMSAFGAAKTGQAIGAGGKGSGK